MDIKREYEEDQREFAKLEEERRQELGLPEEEAGPIVRPAKTTITSDKLAHRTESESESEFQTMIRGNRVQKEFKWTPKTEAKLEEILMKHEFEFKAASREFCEYINKDTEEYYEITAKTIQLRWTDIEIRKFRMESQQNGMDIPEGVKIDVMDPSQLPDGVAK